MGNFTTNRLFVFGTRFFSSLVQKRFFFKSDHSYTSKKRRPTSFLFLAALLGTYILGQYGRSDSLALALIISIIAFLVTRLLYLRIILVLIVTFLLTGTITVLDRKDYENALQVIPKHEEIFSGKVQHAAKKQDGSVAIRVKATPSTGQNDRSFNVQIRLTDEVAEHVKVGSTVRFRGKVQPNDTPLSPVLFNRFRYGLAHQIHGYLTVRDKSAFFLGEQSEQSYFADLREKIVERVMQTITPQEAASLLALMIGDTNLMSDDQEDVYRTLGAQHLLAVSGLQVTLLAYICFLLFIPLFVLLFPIANAHHAQSVAAFLTIGVCFWFVGLSGFQSSAIRALLMASILFLPNFISRTVDPMDSFYASGLITLLVLPTSVYDLGFLLSYAAVFGLLVAHEKSEAIRKRLNDFSRVLGFCFSLIISSIAAFLATMPIIVWNMGVIAPKSIIANSVLVPVATVLQIPAIVLGLVGAILDLPLFINMAALFSNAIEIFANSLNILLDARTLMPSFEAMAIITIVVILGFLFLLSARCAAALASILCFWFAMDHYQKPKELTVTVMPVGQGDATLFSLPSKHHILVDAGGSLQSTFDPGKRVVLPTLKRKGITKLDLLIISHPDPDHILGVFSLFDEIRISEIWHSGFSADHPLTHQLLTIARNHDTTVKTMKSILGTHHFGKTQIEVLAPDTFSDELYFGELKANDNSLVLRILHAGHGLLWPGDIEKFGEALLTSSNKKLTATVLKAPHHGSKTSSSPDFIAAVNPVHVLYSTGTNNRYKFPHEEVTKKYQAQGVTEWNTATDGEITIKITEDNLNISSYKTGLSSG